MRQLRLVMSKQTFQSFRKCSLKASIKIHLSKNFAWLQTLQPNISICSFRVLPSRYLLPHSGRTTIVCLICFGQIDKYGSAPSSTTHHPPIFHESRSVVPPQYASTVDPSLRFLQMPLFVSRLVKVPSESACVKGYHRTEYRQSSQ